MMNHTLIATVVAAVGTFGQIHPAAYTGMSLRHDSGEQSPHRAASGSASTHRLAAEDWDALAARFGGVIADTKASRDVLMTFTISAEVRQVLVKGGQRVKEGDLLIRARDGDQVALVDAQRLSANNDNEVKAATFQLELAELKYSRLKESNQGGKAELDEARIQAATSKVQLEQARVRLDLEVKRLAQAEGQLERYRLVAPFDGVIEEVKADVGQGMREAEPVIRIVNTELLWLDAYAPTMETIELELQKGRPAWVLMRLPDGARMVKGEILYVSPVADSVSQSRRVRVQYANTANWPAGIPAKVVFVQPGAEWDSYLASGVGGSVSRSGEGAGEAGGETEARRAARAGAVGCAAGGGRGWE